MPAEQVGNLSAHALQFARFKRKRLGASKYSNLIFEHFIGVFSPVFSANQKIVNPLHCWQRRRNIDNWSKIGFNFCKLFFPTFRQQIRKFSRKSLLN
jgi:hypothetical protein